MKSYQLYSLAAIVLATPHIPKWFAISLGAVYAVLSVLDWCVDSPLKK